MFRLSLSKLRSLFHRDRPTEPDSIPPEPAAGDRGSDVVFRDHLERIEREVAARIFNLGLPASMIVGDDRRAT